MSRLPRRRRTAKTSTFRTIHERHPRPEFPLEEAVERMVDHKALEEHMHRVEQAIIRSLRDHKGLYWELEELRTQRERDLNEAFFAVGYDHGLADGRAARLRITLPQAAVGAQRLADEVRALAVSSDLSAYDVAAALLETAWTMLFGPPRSADPS